jgi:hypothetical protein
MKIYAVDYENKCIDMDFKSEEEADEVFNAILSSGNCNENTIEIVTDSKGKTFKIIASKGYSKNRTEIMYYIDSGTVA